MKKIILLIMFICISLFIFGCAKTPTGVKEPTFRGDNIVDENKMLQVKEQGYICWYHIERDFNKEYEECIKNFREIYPDDPNLCGIPINYCRDFYENCAEDAIVPAGWFCEKTLEAVPEDEKDHYEELGAKCFYKEEDTYDPGGGLHPKGWDCRLPYKE